MRLPWKYFSEAVFDGSGVMLALKSNKLSFRFKKKATKMSRDF